MLLYFIFAYSTFVYTCYYSGHNECVCDFVVIYSPNVQYVTGSLDWILINSSGETAVRDVTKPEPKRRL